MAKTSEIELDADLLARVDAKAASLGRRRDDVIAEALGRWLEGGRLRAILDANRREAVLSEDEAMALAIAELNAVRSERVTAPGA